jgi:hypothetical protein
VRALAVAPGGHIEQVIVPDIYAPDQWDTKNVVMFNMQLFDTTTFEHVLGIKPPPTPINTQTYALYGYPFYDLYQEPSGIKGDFPVQSVGDLDKVKGTNLETHEAEKDLAFPVANIGVGRQNRADLTEIKLNTVEQKSVFLPIRLMEKKAKDEQDL